MECGFKTINGQPCKTKTKAGRCWRHETPRVELPSGSKSTFLRKVVWKAKLEAEDQISYDPGIPVTVRQFAELAVKEEQVLRSFIELLGQISREHGHFALKMRLSDQPFLMWIVKDPTLDKPANWGMFRMTSPVDGHGAVTAFWNDRRDTCTICPSPPQIPPAVYSSIKEFSLLASMEEQVTFWKFCFMMFVKITSKTPMWLNTHGRGVSWFHVRLDENPTHYEQFF